MSFRGGPVGILLKLLQRRVGRAWTYLLWDRFESPDTPNPLSSPRTCVPGPGTLDIVDTVGGFSIEDKNLRRDKGTQSGWNDPLVNSTSSFSRVCGRALHARVRWSTYPSDGHVRVGWAAAKGSGVWQTTPFIGSSESTCVTFGGFTDTDAYAWTGGTNYYSVPESNPTGWRLLLILRNNGFHALLNPADCLTYNESTWFHLGAWPFGNTTPLYPAVSSYIWMDIGQYMLIDDIRVVDLGGKWATDFGPAVYYQASASSGHTFTSPAFFSAQVVFPMPAYPDNFKFKFFVLDANNYWYVLVEEGWRRLYKVIGGVETQVAYDNHVISPGVSTLMSFMVHPPTGNPNPDWSKWVTVIRVVALNTYSSWFLYASGGGSFFDFTGGYGCEITKNVTDLAVFPRSFPELDEVFVPSPGPAPTGGLNWEQHESHWEDLDMNWEVA